MKAVLMVVTLALFVAAGASWLDWSTEQQNARFVEKRAEFFTVCVQDLGAHRIGVGTECRVRWEMTNGK